MRNVAWIIAVLTGSLLLDSLLLAAPQHESKRFSLPMGRREQSKTREQSATRISSSVPRASSQPNEQRRHVATAMPPEVTIIDDETMEAMRVGPTAHGKPQHKVVRAVAVMVEGQDAPSSANQSQTAEAGSTESGRPGADAIRFQLSDQPPETDRSRCDSNSCREWGQPSDEFVCDGGDVGVRARVRRDWSVDGLELEDTIGHYDTLLGNTNVVSSNRSCVYSPRFGVARQVRYVEENEVHTVAIGSNGLQVPNYQAQDETVGAVKQQSNSVRAVGTSMGLTVEERSRGLLAERVQTALESRNHLFPFQDTRLVEFGVVTVDDRIRLLDGAHAARAWSAVEAPQVTVENGIALIQQSVRQAQESITYETPDGQPKLRLVKLASQCTAQPGDSIGFTIRFDNAGNEPIGNVTIMDLLTYRLEYVDQSQKCSVPSRFHTQQQDGTLKLRWEIIEPLEPGSGGVLQFECKVR